MRELRLKLSNVSQQAITVVGDIINANVNEIAAEATQNAPALFKTQNGGFPTNGEIVQSINVTRNSNLKSTVSVNSVMGAYAEFGTGAFVDVPEGWENVAWSYYINGKGTIMPTPFLIPAFNKGKIRTIKDLENYLDEIAK